MDIRNIIAIGSTGAVFIFFLILITYAAYGVVISFLEQTTLTNFKNFAVSNGVLIVIGAFFFVISLICMFMMFRKIDADADEITVPGTVAGPGFIGRLGQRIKKGASNFTDNINSLRKNLKEFIKRKNNATGATAGTGTGATAGTGTGATAGTGTGATAGTGTGATAGTNNTTSVTEPLDLSSELIIEAQDYLAENPGDPLVTDLLRVIQEEMMNRANN